MILVYDIAVAYYSKAKKILSNPVNIVEIVSHVIVAISIFCVFFLDMHIHLSSFAGGMGLPLLYFIITHEKRTKEERKKVSDRLHNSYFTNVAITCALIVLYFVCKYLFGI